MAKKLVILSAFYEPYMSGAERMAKEILERLGNKYDMVLLTGRFDRKLPFREKRPGFVIYRLGIGDERLDKFLYPVLAAFKVQSLKPDIVHAVMESYAGGALALVRFIYPRARRILTLQSGNLDDPAYRRKPLVRGFWKLIHRSPHIVTAISSYLAGRAEKLGVAKDRIFLTPNGLDLSQVPAGSEKSDDAVVCVGRLSWEKGHTYLLDAWPEVTKRFPGARLKLIGEGPERERIEEKIRSMNLGESVILTGNLPLMEVLAEMTRAEVFVCPSLAEGLGNVFIEAQACGTPPIGTRVGGIPDVITDEENGLLIEPRNSKAVAAAIIRLLSDKDLAARLRANGLMSVKKFDWNNIMKKIDEIYRGAC